jgi:hypothetical protein
MTQDQSPASALQLFARNFRTQTPRRTETASRFAAPRMRRHFGCDFVSGFKKRTHAVPTRTGGENTKKTLRMVSNHNPCMIGEYAIKALGRAQDSISCDSPARKSEVCLEEAKSSTSGYSGYRQYRYRVFAAFSRVYLAGTVGRMRLIWRLVGVEQFNTYATDFVRVHIVVLPGMRFSDIPPCPGLPDRKAHLFICGGSFG